MGDTKECAFKPIGLRGNGEPQDMSASTDFLGDAEMMERVREAFNNRGKPVTPACPQISADTRALIAELLQNLPQSEHAGVLERYGLKVSDFEVEQDVVEQEELFVDEIKNINSDKQESRSVNAMQKDGMNRQASRQINEEVTEMGDNRIVSATKNIAQTIQDIVLDTVNKRRAQVTTEEQPPLDKPVQKKVKLPQGDEQVELTTTDAEAEAAGSKKDSITIASLRKNDMVYLPYDKRHYKVISVDKRSVSLKNGNDILVFGNDDLRELKAIKRISQQSQMGPGTAGEREMDSTKNDVDIITRRKTLLTDIDGANDNVVYEEEDEDGAGREKTDISEDSYILEDTHKPGKSAAARRVRRSQQMELLDEEAALAELNKDDAGDATRRDLGEVKTPDIHVVADPTSQTRDMRSVDDDTNFAEQDSMILSDDKSDAHLPGARSVSKVSTEPQKKLYLAAFKQGKDKLNSKWVISAQGKPIFAISLKSAFEGSDAIKNWSVFRSDIYRRKLEGMLNRFGAKKIIETEFGGPQYIEFFGYKPVKSQVMGEEQSYTQDPYSGGGGMGMGVSPREPETNMGISHETDDKLSNDSTGLEAPVVQIVSDVLAPIISAAPEAFDVDTVTQELEASFSDPELVSEFKGELTEKVNNIGYGDNGDDVDNVEHDDAELKKFARRVSKGNTKDIFRGLMRCAKRDKIKIDYLNQTVSDLQKEVQGYKLAEKSKRVSAILTNMVKKGMLPYTKESLAAKSKELIDFEDKDLKVVESMVRDFPTPKEVVATKQGKTEPKREVISQLPSDVGMSSYDVSGQVNNLEGLWTSPPVIDEDTRSVK